MMSDLFLILFIFIMFYLTWRWSYRLIVMLLAAINENPDRTEKVVLLRLAEKDKLWHDVVKELGLLDE